MKAHGLTLWTGRTWRTLILALLAGVMALGWTPANVPAQSVFLSQFEGPTSYSRFYEPGRISRRIPGALWQDDVDTAGKRTYFPVPASAVGPQAVTVGRDEIIYVKGGQLVARDLRGRLLWRAGHGFVPAILQRQDRVFAARKDGTIFAFRLPDGRLVWSARAALQDIDQFAAKGDLLFANNRVQGFVALRPETGAVLWRSLMPGDPGYSFGPQLNAHGVVVTVRLWGEPMQEKALGLDARSGRQIWRVGGWFPLALRGHMLVIRNHGIDTELVNQFRIDVLHLRTGKLQQSFTYTFRPPDPRWEPRYEPAQIEGQDVYVIVECAIYRLRLGRPAPTVYQIRGSACKVTDGEARWLAGPYRNRVFLWDGKSLYSLDLNTRETQTYVSVGTRVSRLLLAGNRMYVGQIDGWFRILDMTTGAELLRVHTGGRNFDFKLGPGVVVVQAEQRIAVFRAP